VGIPAGSALPAGDVGHVPVERGGGGCPLSGSNREAPNRLAWLNPNLRGGFLFGALRLWFVTGPRCAPVLRGALEA